MIKNPFDGKYVMLEGPEGGGKTSQTLMLLKKLEGMGQAAIAVKEPNSGNVFGRLAHAIYTCESIYDELPGKLLECVSSPRYEFIKEATAESGRVHIEHFEEIMREVENRNHTNLPMLLQLSMIFSRLELLLADVIPQLKKGVGVVSDRGFLSTLAYGKMDGLDWRKLLEFHGYILGENFIIPDITFVFDVSLETGLDRTYRKQLGKRERHDDPKTFAKVREAYLTLMEEPELKDKILIVKINGEGTPEQVHDEVWRHVSELLGLR